MSINLYKPLYSGITVTKQGETKFKIPEFTLTSVKTDTRINQLENRISFLETYAKLYIKEHDDRLNEMESTLADHVVSYEDYTECTDDIRDINNELETIYDRISYCEHFVEDYVDDENTEKTMDEFRELKRSMLFAKVVDDDGWFYLPHYHGEAFKRFLHKLKIIFWG